VTDPKHFELERSTADDYMLPPEDTWSAVAKELRDDDRAHLRERTVVLVVRAHEEQREETTPRKHLPLRATRAVANLLVRSLSGVVYDETLRTIGYGPPPVAVSLDAPAFTPSQIVVQSYAEPDGRMRLVTLGMAAFGSPDLALRSVPAGREDAAAHLVNAVASKVARGESRLPIEVAPADVAFGTAKPGATPTTIDAFVPDRTAGDPDNVLLELLPPGGESAESWSAALDALFGDAPRLVHADQDERLLAIAEHARKTLPDPGDGGTLFVKGPFPYDDGGREWMWIEARHCDARGCSGPLTNDPSFAVSFHKGDDAGVRVEDVADWLLTLPDGGSVGGASVLELERR
jgi:hypothetical protein